MEEKIDKISILKSYFKDLELEMNNSLLMASSKSTEKIIETSLNDSIINHYKNTRANKKLGAQRKSIYNFFKNVISTYSDIKCHGKKNLIKNKI